MLTTKEAAQRLGLKTTGAVRQLILSGRLQAEKHGRDWQIDAQSVETYKNSPRKPGPKRKPMVKSEVVKKDTPQNRSHSPETNEKGEPL